jgi:hypothetical protein
VLRPLPVTLEEFLCPPTLEEWEAEIAAGWPGPDGSTSSLDDVEGVRIGISSPDFMWALLPANLHDWRYRLSRRCGGLPKAWRQAADAAYRDGCAQRVRETLIGWRVWAGARRAEVRYVGLRWFGRFVWS